MDGPPAVGTAFAAMLLWICSCGPETPADPRTLREEDPVRITELLTTRTEVLDDSLGLTNASDIRPLPGGRYLITDMRVDEVVVLDASLEVLRRIGGTGSGPRDLRGPYDLSLAGSEIGVADRANGRIVVLDVETLEPTRWLALPSVGPFALLADSGSGAHSGLVALPPDSAGFGFTFLPDGGAVTFDTAQELERTRFEKDTRIATRMVSDAWAGRVIVWDEGTTAVLEYDAYSGQVLDVGLLPARFQASIRRTIQAYLDTFSEMDVLVEATRVGIVDLVRTGPRSVLLLTSLFDGIGLFVDFETRTIREVLLPSPFPGAQPPGWGMAAYHADTLAAITSGRIDLFRLELP